MYAANVYTASYAVMEMLGNFLNSCISHDFHQHFADNNFWKCSISIATNEEMHTKSKHTMAGAAKRRFLSPLTDTIIRHIRRVFTGIESATTNSVVRNEVAAASIANPCIQ